MKEKFERLAHEAWPGRDVHVTIYAEGAGWAVHDVHGFLVMMVDGHPRAVDGLAALLETLTEGEGPSVAERLMRLERQLEAVRRVCTYPDLMNKGTRRPRLHLRGDEVLAALGEEEAR
jgi:hypothetical protein